MMARLKFNEPEITYIQVQRFIYLIFKKLNAMVFNFSSPSANDDSERKSARCPFAIATNATFMHLINR